MQRPLSFRTEFSRDHKAKSPSPPPVPVCTPSILPPPHHASTHPKSPPLRLRPQSPSLPPSTRCYLRHFRLLWLQVPNRYLSHFILRLLNPSGQVKHLPPEKPKRGAFGFLLLGSIWLEPGWSLLTTHPLSRRELFYSEKRK